MDELANRAKWTRAEKLRICFDVIVLATICAGIYFGGWFLAPAP